MRILSLLTLLLWASMGLGAPPPVTETAGKKAAEESDGHAAVISISERSAAENFKLSDLKGNPHRLSDYKGKVVVISFWATWCKPCLRELTFLKSLKAQHPGKLEILAIATDGPNTASRIRPTVKRKKLTMPVLLDSDGSVMASMNSRGILPQSNYIDKQGKLAYAHTGFVSGDEEIIEKAILKLLGEK